MRFLQQLKASGLASVGALIVISCTRPVPEPRSVSPQVLGVREALRIILTHRSLPETVPFRIDSLSLARVGGLSGEDIHDLAVELRPGSAVEIVQMASPCESVCTTFFLRGLSVRTDTLTVRAQWQSRGEGRCISSYMATYDVVFLANDPRIAAVREEDRSHCGG